MFKGLFTALVSLFAATTSANCPVEGRSDADLVNDLQRKGLKCVARGMNVFEKERSDLVTNVKQGAVINIYTCLPAEKGAFNNLLSSLNLNKIYLRTYDLKDREVESEDFGGKKCPATKGREILDLQVRGASSPGL